VTEPTAAPLAEPVVRIRCAPEEEARTRAALEKAGLAGERSLLHLVVRDRDPDQVNEALAAGGAPARVVVRERLGALIGWLVDHGGEVAGREAALERLARRVLDEGGLAGRYALRDGAALAAAARALHEHLMATGGGLVAWRAFVEGWCVPRPAGEAAAPPAPAQPA
jgi:hypothetical protein